MSQILWSNITSDAILLFLPYGLLQISLNLGVLNTSLEATLNPFQYKTDC